MPIYLNGIPKDSPAGRKQFERRMELRRAAEDGEEFGPLEDKDKCQS